MRFAASIGPDLHRYIRRLAKDRALSIADVNRRVGERAEALGRLRPSYAAVRLVVQEARARRLEPSWGDVAARVVGTGNLDLIVAKQLGLLAYDPPAHELLPSRPRRSDR